ncbi:YadA C-terminal domain-containing protein, partial [Streptobacillus notomytis]
DKLTFGPKDENSADKTSTTIEKSGVTVKGKDGKESVTIKAGNGTDGGIIKLSDKDGKETIKIDGGKSSITGLKDISPDETDGSIAVNKNYVDNKIKEIANGPFEYSTNNNEKVVRGQDNKLYKESELKNFYYDTNENKYKPKNNANGNGNNQLTPVDSKDVIVNLMPKGNGNEPISIGNVKSILGEDATPEKIKEFLEDKDDIFKNNKNNVATGTDLKALAKAGINFSGNTGAGEEVHRNLGEKVIIKGEGTDNKDDFTSASGNIQVSSEKNSSTLTVKLSDKLKEMTSFETKELDDNNIKSKTKLDKEGLTTINKTDDNKYIMSKTGPNGIEIGKYNDNPLTKANEQATNSSKYTLDGTTIKDDKGEGKLTSNKLSLKDKDDKKGITLNNEKDPTIILTDKEGKETVKIEGGEKEPTISLKTEGEKGLGVLKGLRDLTENDPGHYAVNKRYVDERLTTATSGVANAIAAASIPQISNVGDRRHNIGASYGYYEGQSAFAIGLSGINEVGNVLYKANLSLNTKGKVGIGAGISYQFGGGEKKGREEIVIERPINKELEEQNKKLIEDNKRLEKANKDITDTIEELKERIKAL